uniref:Uncharacterized protein n=1 Tax=Balaenoptera musculus TaxID=9771 RepID=A0A8C0CA09_BALMU
MLQLAWLTGPKSAQSSPQGACGPEARAEEPPVHLGRVAGPPERVSQTRLLAHSDGDVVVPIILGDQGHHRPVPGGVGGIDGDELFGAVLGEPVHLNGVAHGVGEKEHLNLFKATGVSHLVEMVPQQLSGVI